MPKLTKAQMERNQRGVSPMNATFAEMCRLKRDHIGCADWSIMTDGYTVWLSRQKSGEQPTQHFKITRRAFNRLLRWYINEQKFVRRKP